MSDPIRYWRLAAGAQATLGEAKIDAEGKDERRGFSMLAYTGDEVLLQLQMFAPPERVVFDLSGMSVKREVIPILAYHDIHQIAGQSSLIANNGERIDIQGHLSSTTDTGRMVAGLSDEGFPWEASIGLEATKIEEVAEGDTVELNGRTFDGPLVVARKFTLKESSFVPFGADSATSAFALSGGGSLTGPLTAKENDMDNKATLAELKAAFPSDLEFVIEAAEGELTIEAAKALAYERLVASHAAQDATNSAALQAAKTEAETAKAELARVQLNPPVATTRSGFQAISGDFKVKVQELKDAGKSGEDALKIAGRRYPELRKAMLAEANGGQEPSDFKLTGVFQ